MSATSAIRPTDDELKRAPWARILHIESGTSFRVDAKVGPRLAELIDADEAGLVVGDDWRDWQKDVRRLHEAYRLTVQEVAFRDPGDDLRTFPRVRLILRTSLSLVERLS